MTTSSVDSDSTDPRLSPEEEEELAEIGVLGEEDPARALEAWFELPEALKKSPDARLLLGALHFRLDDLPRARRVAEELVRQWPEDADAHHLFGDVCLELGEDETSVRHFLRTLELDRRLASERSPDERAELFDLVLRLLEESVAEIPERFRSLLGDVPLLVEDLPSPDLVEEGLDPRSLGVFEGPDHARRGSPEPLAAPTRIVLFAENLAAEFSDPDEFAEQIRITVLHEVGHYFGLDEDDMVRLGLD